MVETIKIIPKYYFGADVVNKHLVNELKQRHVKTLLLAYGGGSIKRNHLYDEIISAAKKAKVKVIEHAGIEPNPRDLGIYEATLKCRKHKVDLIIAAGGGSVIDAAKVIGILATNPQYKNAWSYVLNSKLVKNPSIPLFSIITLAATASENNAGSVVTNAKTRYKQSVVTPTATPLVCFQDPKYTLTLSWWQTACGIFDILSHLFEQYYDPIKTFKWSKEYMLANMRVVVDCARSLKKNPSDYEARSNLLWASAWSLNSLPTIHTNGGDWTTHRLEHAVSGLWDVEHGAGLALLTPTYLQYMCKKNKRFVEYSLEIGKDIFHTKTLPDFFKALNQFITLLGMPKKFTDFQVIKSVSQTDIDWLVSHYATVMDLSKNNEKVKMARAIFTKLK